MEEKKILKNRTGEINYNNFGSKMTIISYINCDNITVKFDNGSIINSRYDHFKEGVLRSPYCKTIYGMGYIGEGKYESHIENKITKTYQYWHGILTRCYSNNFQEKNPTYKNCEVCDDWNNFQNFGKWYDENYYEINGEKMQLDKDILNKGNKIYSPDTCVFVPQRINTLFTKNEAKRGNFPIGVSWNKTIQKYASVVSVYNTTKKKKERKSLGYFDTQKETFDCYKNFKENYIKEVADYYKDQIPKKLYKALYRYKVEITD
jgi:hypothetical protein